MIPDRKKNVKIFYESSISVTTNFSKPPNQIKRLGATHFDPDCMINNNK